MYSCRKPCTSSSWSNTIMSNLFAHKSSAVSRCYRVGMQVGVAKPGDRLADFWCQTAILGALVSSIATTSIRQNKPIAAWPSRTSISLASHHLLHVAIRCQWRQSKFIFWEKWRTKVGPKARARRRSAKCRRVEGVRLWLWRLESAPFPEWWSRCYAPKIFWNFTCKSVDFGVFFSSFLASFWGGEDENELLPENFYWGR